MTNAARRICYAGVDMLMKAVGKDCTSLFSILCWQTFYKLLPCILGGNGKTRAQALCLGQSCFYQLAQLLLSTLYACTFMQCLPMFFSQIVFVHFYGQFNKDAVRLEAGLE